MRALGGPKKGNELHGQEDRRAEQNVQPVPLVDSLAFRQLVSHGKCSPAAGKKRCRRPDAAKPAPVIVER